MNSGNGSRLTAVLGPTNTGKTHLAIERMLGHTTGMIGFPLRLLARGFLYWPSSFGTVSYTHLKLPTTPYV